MSTFEHISTFATLPRTTRGMPMVMGSDPKGKNFLYTNGNSVIIRDISNPSQCDTYTEHSCPVNVAKYSPSGFYICSGDNNGKIRIWDTVNKTHILKNEYCPFAGPIKDLDWSGDNQRICAVGQGRSTYGHVFNAETGTSVGEISGQSKTINSVSFRQSRPMRIATACEDNSLAFFEGPPFKFVKTMNDHSRFAQCVRYAPSGDIFVSGGADGKAFVYDGKTGDKIKELGEPAHKGGIYAVCFSPDSKEVVTASGDKSCRIWNVEDNTMVCEFVLGTKVEDMQLGCLWQGDTIISVSLSGNINYLDRANPAKPHRIVKGHNKPVTCMAVSADKSTIFSGSSDGLLCHWDVQTGHNDTFQGKGHSNQIQDMAVGDDNLVTIGIDDVLISSPIGTSQYGQPVKMPSQPRGVAVAGGSLYVVACINHIALVRDGRVIFNEKVEYEPLSVGVAASQGEVAIGGGQDNNVHVYTINGDTLQAGPVLDQTGSITSIKYSPDGVYMAAADSNRKIVLYTLPNYEKKVSTQWCGHTARVNCLSWSPDSLFLASGGLDTNICLWNPAKIMNSKELKNAHPQNQVVRVEWLDSETLVSAGSEGSIKKWKVDVNASGMKGVH